MSEKIPPSGKFKNIYQRMLEVQKAVQSVQKNETVKMSERDKGYKAVTHDDVAAALHGPLAEAGIVLLPNVLDFKTEFFDIEKKSDRGAYTQRWYRTDLRISVKWINADQPEDFIESTGGAFALDTSDKSFAKAYSLALKIILLKVHLLESRDGEEERTFETGGDRPPARPGPSGPLPKAQPKSTAKPPPTKKPAGNFAPASDEQIEMLYSLAIDRQVSEGVLNHLIQSYGVQPGSRPLKWIADEIGKLLENEDTNEATLMAESQRVISRREAARIKAETEKRKAADE